MRGKSMYQKKERERKKFITVCIKYMRRELILTLSLYILFGKEE